MSTLGFSFISLSEHWMALQLQNALLGGIFFDVPGVSHSHISGYSIFKFLILK